MKKKVIAKKKKKIIPPSKRAKKKIISKSSSKKKIKNQRKDSEGISSEIMQEAINGVNVPPHIKLRKQDLPFWKAIIDARLQWTSVDLAHAANLARCQADIEENQEKLDKEGSVIKNARGTPVMNPRFTILEQLSRRSVSISSKIQVHAAATIGETKLNRGKNKAKQDALNNMDKLEDADNQLIASPKPEVDKG